MKKILIVDDHEIVRQGLRLLLNDFYQGAEIDEASNGRDAEIRLKAMSYSLVILDIQMPDTNSFELINYIITLHPQTKILVFSMSSEILYGKRVIKAGAHGYLSKDSSMEEVKKAIKTIFGNKKYLSSKLVESIVDETAGDTVTNPFSCLSAREFEIATFLLAGISVSEIARQVHLQASTVATYKSRIFEKLGVSNIIQLKELATLYNFS